jgi:hypothetical protein
MQGWITLHRKIEENDLWLAEPFTRGQAWVDLLLIANHKPQLLYKRNIPITIERGQVGWSQERLGKRWKWGRKKVAGFLKTLENAQQIKLDNNHTLSRIIIVNYDKYQQKEQQSHNSRTTDRTNNNNDNNDNNSIGETSSPELQINLNHTMGWNDKSDDYEEGVVDLDGDISLVEEKKAPTKKYPNAPAVRKVFQEVLGVCPANWKVNKTQLQASENLYTERSIEKVRLALQFYQEHKDVEFCPQISSPYDLDSKWAKLGAFKIKKT